MTTAPPVASPTSPASPVNPGELVVAAVERILQVAATWPAWDGRPRLTEDGTRIYTPNKAMRRHGDHLTDHLAEIEALLAGASTEPDNWHASSVTLASDWAPFTEADLNEAGERFRRLARSYVFRLQAAGPAEWDRRRDPNWTVRQIAEHVASAWYAEQVGTLPAASADDVSPLAVRPAEHGAKAAAEFIFHEWDRRARSRDVAGLVDLYAEHAVLESPLVPRILGQPSGVLRGKDELARFFEGGGRRRPNELVRWHRSGSYLWDGHTLSWEYQRMTPEGDQVDIAEVMDVADGRITAHRIYWGWFGTEMLIASAAHKPHPRKDG
jgi:hypothetical protein